MKKHVNMNYNQITKNIYIGTNNCCQTHFEKELLDRGITVNLSLEKERLDAPFGVKYFLWLPTKDKAAPTQDTLKLGVAVITKCIELKKVLYIHCMNGHGRAPTLVAAYFISLGDSVDDAIEKIRQKRPEIHLEDVQYEALKNFAKKM